MPALRDDMLELFAAGLAQGLGKYVAYRQAGYQGSPPACSSLIRTHPDLALRVAELQREMPAMEIAERVAQRQRQRKKPPRQIFDQVAQRVVADRVWALGKLQAIVDTPSGGPPRVGDHVAAIQQMARLAGWDNVTSLPGRTAVEAGAVRELTPAEVRTRWADGIEEAAAKFGTDSVQELVAQMRRTEEQG